MYNIVLLSGAQLQTLFHCFITRRGLWLPALHSERLSVCVWPRVCVCVTLPLPHRASGTRVCVLCVFCK